MRKKTIFILLFVFLVSLYSSLAYNITFETLNNSGYLLNNKAIWLDSCSTAGDPQTCAKAINFLYSGVGWETPGATPPHVINFDFGSAQNINCTFFEKAGTCSVIQNYQFDYSNDNSSWTKLVGKAVAGFNDDLNWTNPIASDTRNFKNVSYAFFNVTARWFRIYITATDCGYGGLQEIEFCNATAYVSPPPPDIFNLSYVSKSPTDLTFLNSIGGINVTYNFIYGQNINFSFKTNSTTSNIFKYVAGVGFSDYQTTTSYLNDSNNIKFLLDDNDVLPGTYNINPETTEFSIHNKTSLVTPNTIYKINISNISSDKQFSLLEINARGTTNHTNLDAYYCNSSYSNGLLSTSNFCSLFKSVAPTTLYNHSHGSNSSHLILIMPINITSKTINNVGITPTGFIILKADGWNLSYVSNNTNTIQYSGNGGNTYSNFVGTVDLHIHQISSNFSDNSTFYFYSCAINSSNTKNYCTSVLYDNFEIGGLPPTQPTIISIDPNSYIKGNVTISYLPSVSPNNVSLTYYNITLRNTNENYNYSIKGNNGLNTSYVFDTGLVTDGNYLIRVSVCDTNGLCNYDQDNVTIDNTKPIISLIYPPDYVLNYSGAIINLENINFTFYANDTNLNNCSILINNFYGGGFRTYPINNLIKGLNNHNFTGFTDGVRNWSVSCSDVVNNTNTTNYNAFIVDLTAPLVSSVSPLNNSKLSATYNISFSITATDFQSFVYLIQSNVTYANGTYLLNMNYTDNGSMDNVKTLSDTKLIYENANFNFSYYVCDGHTANPEQFNEVVKAPIIDAKTNALDFQSVKIIPQTNILSSSTTKLSDRYSFSFVTEKTEVKTDILVNSKEKLKYYPNSKYPGHFIDGVNKIWIDFSDFGDIEVRKIDDYNYMVSTYPETKTITANSVGALNCIYGKTYFNVSIDGLDIYLYDYGSNANLTNFNVTIGGVTTQTNNGTIHYNLTTGTYEATFKAPTYADKLQNISVIGYTSIYSPMYKINSILVNIFDEDSGFKINNSEVLFDANVTYYQNFITSNGSVYVVGLPSSFYSIKTSSADYVSRYNYVTLNNNYAVINSYLLNNSNLVVLSIKSEATDKFIDQALITLNRRINGSWVNVGSAITDGVGSARFGMKEGETYNVFITASGYDTKYFTLTPFESAYTIYIQKQNTLTFYTLFDKIAYSINPKKSVIPPSSIQNPITCFNLSVVSPGGYLEYIYINGSFNNVVNSSNITGATTGGIAQFCLDLRGFEGYNFSVDYKIKVANENLWYGRVNYWIDNRTYGSVTPALNVSDYSVAGWLTNYKNEISPTWKIIIMIGIALALMITFSAWLPPIALGIIGVIVIGIISFYWFPTYIVIIEIIVMIMAIMVLAKGDSG